MSGPLSDAEIVVSLKGTHFTGAIVLNAIESESLNFPTDWQTLGVEKCIIEGLSIQSDQNLEWDVYIWNTSDYNSTDLDAAKLVDQINYASTAGKRIAGANQYFYASPTLEVPYEDKDKTSKLHLSLVNRSATAKIAGASGEIVLRLTLRPIRGK
ncbi:MAG: hypothetical protein KAT00_13775 [Planctomycetes bacterium]|nr:hypothetical protein [Planctomycetota bacterium]